MTMTVSRLNFWVEKLKQHWNVSRRVNELHSFTLYRKRYQADGMQTVRVLLMYCLGDGQADKMAQADKIVPENMILSVN